MSARKLPASGDALRDLFGPEAKRLADLRSLPFVVDRVPTPDDDRRRVFWRNAGTEDGIADELLGGAWALRLLEYRSRHPDASPLLPSIVAARATRSRAWQPTTCSSPS
ncbi:MAG: hypothetical protein JO157_05665 [Acetobacteraceae bacterium]|nr:hypothetical protein [Acetobacteraceae bacterium]